MFRWTLLPCLLVCAAVHAAPTTVAEDAVERLLTDKGLIERLNSNTFAIPPAKKRQSWS